MEHGRLDNGSNVQKPWMLGSLGIVDYGVWAGRDFVPGGDTTVNIVGAGLILICN